MARSKSLPVQSVTGELEYHVTVPDPNLKNCKIGSTSCLTFHSGLKKSTCLRELLTKLKRSENFCNSTLTAISFVARLKKCLRCCFTCARSKVQRSSFLMRRTFSDKRSINGSLLRLNHLRYWSKACRQGSHDQRNNRN